MAKIVGAYAMSHSMYSQVPVERWSTFYTLKRIPREGVPQDTLAESARKIERVRKAIATLRAKVLEAKPDVLVVFGDDQLECFDYSNMPAFAVYAGAQFSGHDTEVFLARPTQSAPQVGPQREVPGHPELALGLVRGLLGREFDPAYCLSMPKPETGLGHAFMRPAEWLAACAIPLVPVLVNCFFSPQPSALRCYQLGRAVRQIIEEYPQDLRVAIVGSGGLWHTPGQDKPYIDTEFDGTILERLKTGDAQRMAEYFDSYRVPEGDVSQDSSKPGRFNNGIPSYGGPQGGTREISNWVAAASALEGRPWTVVDYVPVYATPMGMGFAYCAVS